MPKLTKASFAAAKRRLGIKKVSKKNIGRIAKAARRGTKSQSSSPRKTRARKTSPKRRTHKRGKNMSKHKSLFQAFKKLALGGSLVVPAIATLISPADKATKIQWLSRRYFGYDTKTRKFTLHDLKDGWGPFAVTVLVTTGISKARGMLRRL